MSVIDSMNLTEKWNTGLVYSSSYEYPGLAVGKDGTIYVTNRMLDAIGKPYLPPNQANYSDHIMSLAYDGGSQAVINYNHNYPSDIVEFGQNVGNMIRWQISTDGNHFTDVGVTFNSKPGQAILSGLDATKGYYLRTLYKNSDGRVIPYQRMILRPDKYTGAPLPTEQQVQPVLVPSPALTLINPTLIEDSINDGSISAKQVVTLTNGTFAADMSTGVTVNNLPAGLGIAVTRDSDKQITISFTGKATAHANANDVTNATVTIDKAKITGATANVTSNAFAIDFQDGASNVTNFRQTAVTQTTATLAWDTVAGADSYIIKNDTGESVYSGAALTTVVSGLKPKSTYSFTIIAKGKDGESTPTALTVTTPAIVDPMVDQVNTTKNSVSFDIQEVEGAKKYVVNRNPEWTYEAAGGNRYEVTWKNTATGEGPTSLAPVYSSNGKIPHTETGLSANTPYTYTVTAYDESGNTSAPQQVKATTAPLSTLADLKSLSLSQGTLTPAFAANTVSYTAIVTNATASVNVSAAAADHMAKVTINGNEAKSAVNVPLQVGKNTVTVIATSEDGSASRMYTITVTREEASFGTFNVNASNLTQTGGKLLWTNLGAGVTYTVTLTPNDGTSSISGNGATLTDLRPSTDYQVTVTALKTGYADKQATTTFKTLAPVSGVKKPSVKQVRMVDASTVLFTVESIDGDTVKVNGVTKAKEGTSTLFDVSVPAGTGSQTFTVTALRGQEESDPVTVTIDPTDLATKIVDVNTIKLENQQAAAKVSWGAVPGVSRYRVDLLKVGSDTPVTLTVASTSTLANITYGEYDVTIYTEYKGNWGMGVTKRLTFASPTPTEQNPTDFQAVDGPMAGSKVLSWKGTTGIQVIELKQNGELKDSQSTRFLKMTFYNLQNGTYDVFIAGKSVGSFAVTTGKEPGTPGNGGNTETPANLVVTDGSLPGSKNLAWTGTTKIVKVELKQKGETKHAQDTRFTKATFYNLTNGDYDVFVANTHLGTLTVSNAKDPSNPGEGTPGQTPKNLQVTDGTVKGSKVVKWEGTTEVVTVELKKGDELKASERTRFLSATFYNLENGTYDVYVSGVKLGSFDVTGNTPGGGDGGKQPEVPTNLEVKDGVSSSKIVSWQGTTTMVTVELKQEGVTKAQETTRFTNVTFTNLAAGTYDVYVAGTNLGTFTVTTTTEPTQPTTPAEPTNLAVKDGSIPGTKTISWQGTNTLVAVELKQVGVIKANQSTRFTSVTFSNLAAGTYEVFIAGKQMGTLTVESTTVPGQPVIEYNPVLTVAANPNYKTLTWQGTTGLVNVELKEGEQVVKTTSTRFTNVSLFQLPDKVYGFFLNGKFAGYVSIQTQFVTPDNVGVTLKNGKFIVTATQQPFTGDVNTLTVFTPPPSS
ncbi:cadherin-like beta sandwich domain-containing protein [Brevibacillus sp. NPDC003359]|uniref:cadherin-like beta sandwich domain-containing protein n=1 Tax=unclassified Brevibacillus TaxID=2684853 RepID=UPI0036C1AC0C